MFIYDKKLQFPVKIDRPNPRLASVIISQYGGPDGELGASLRYLSQRYSMPLYRKDSISAPYVDRQAEVSRVCIVNCIVNLTKTIQNEEFRIQNESACVCGTNRDRLQP